MMSLIENGYRHVKIYAALYYNINQLITDNYNDNCLKQLYILRKQLYITRC